MPYNLVYNSVFKKSVVPGFCVKVLVLGGGRGEEDRLSTVLVMFVYTGVPLCISNRQYEKDH